MSFLALLTELYHCSFGFNIFAQFDRLRVLFMMRGIRLAHSANHKTTMAHKGHAANKKETTQTKKKTRKQNRNHANKKETTQTKKKTQTKKRNHAHKTEATQTKQKPRTQNRNHANKKETRSQSPCGFFVLFR